MVPSGRFVRRSLLGLSMGVVATACSFLTSFDDIDTSGKLAVSDDAGSDVQRDVAVVDARPDAPVDVDAGRDCDGATFCDDFDVGTLGARWDEVPKQDGRLVLDPTVSRSPPSSLKSSLSLQAPSEPLALKKNFPNVTTIRLSAAILIDGPAVAGGEAHLLAVGMNDPTKPAYAVSFALGARTGAPEGRMFVRESYAATGEDAPMTVDHELLGASVSLGNAWKKITLQLNVLNDGAPTRASWIRLFVDDVEVLKTETAMALDPGNLVVLVGVVAASTTNPVKVHWDDVRVETQP